MKFKEAKGIVNRDVKSMIFRRQTIYFFVLLGLAIPYAAFIFFMGYLVNKYKGDALNDAM